MSTAEEDLRELLERLVPRPEAPPDRLAAIRRKAALRRRHRAAAAVTTGVTVAAALGTALGPAADTARSGQLSPTTASTAAAPTYRTVRVPALFGLTLALPGGWYATPGRAGKALASAFAASQALAAARCQDVKPLGDFTCVPLTHLASGGVVVAFRESPISAKTTARRQPTFTKWRAQVPEAGCQALGGTQEVIGMGASAVSATGQHAITAYACLDRPKSTTLGVVNRLLATAAIQGGAPAPTPTSTPTATSASG